ncbi:MAG: molybdate ABC transporter substrate-binding protein [Methylophilaceae bacterium]|nr:molybdate ABC transporter substrate-binding protein [Methylophilaceae bacterium]
MKSLYALALIFMFGFGQAAHAEKITIAAAADLKFAMDEIVRTFRQIHGSDEVEVIYGSSGKFNMQIRHGAPYDLFFSADIAYPRELVKAGHAVGEVRPYALGRIVLWSASLDASKMTLESLASPHIGRIAIANPKHAPYGKRAEEALKAVNLWERIQSKLVMGDNVSQAAQFVQTGNAQVGIIALSLAINPELARQGGYYLIPDVLHRPLEQGFVITRRAASNPLARRFADFMDTPAARAVMIKNGFR